MYIYTYMRVQILTQRVWITKMMPLVSNLASLLFDNLALMAHGD